MKHTYQISGMTCNGCRSDVEKRLHAVPGVKEAMVTLENEQAVVLMDTFIAVDIFQKALPKKYSVTEKENVFKSSAFDKTAPLKSKLAQLKPLF
ncbi:MAG: copper chaperone CopZ, partial [Patiriisocius sp.]